MGLLMWEIDKMESSKQNIKFRVLETGSPVSNRYFLELLGKSQSFRKFYNGFLADSGFGAFFWENRPMMDKTLENEYECNIINSDFLANQSPDSQTFKQHFNKSKRVVTFPNLGNDAELIVPCPAEQDETYTHIGNFVRQANQNQIHDFWRITGKVTLRSIGNTPKWLSTSGLGVFWLHVRIDSKPKYYQTDSYKTL